MAALVHTWQRFHLGRWALLVVVLIFLALPLPQIFLSEQDLVTESLLFSLTQMFILIILASNWNLTAGFTGYVDFGHVVFFGIGAYITGILMGQPPTWELWPALLTGWAFWPALFMGAVGAAIFAVGIGAATLRLKGPYFSIAMLGTAVVMRELVRVVRPLTGGGVGLTLPPYLNRPLFYYLTLIFGIFVVTLIWWIRRTEFGSTLIAIREDEVGAEMRGINTTLHKITAFWISAFLTGLVGGIWAYQNTFIDPDIVFVPARTVDMVMSTMLGGLGTIAGPVIGAALLYWLRDVVWSNFLLYHQIFEGILLILLVLFVPEGIMGVLGDRSGTSLAKLWRKWFHKPSEDRKQPV